MRCRLVALAFLLSACSPQAAPTPVTPAPSPPASTVAPVVSVAPDIAPPAPPPELGLGELEVAFKFPAWDAVRSGDTVIVVDADFTSLSAHDVVSGARRWRTVVQKEAAGRHTLSLRGSAVLFWAGSRLHRIDARSGAALSSEEVPGNGECTFDESNGVCAFACKCSVALASCDTGKRIGTTYRNTYIEEFGVDGEPPHAGCFGSGTGLLAGTDKVAILEIEDQTGKQLGHVSREHAVVGLDTRTGAELWRTRALAGGYGSQSGAAGDRAWKAGSDGDLQVFDPRNGKLIFQRPGLSNLGRVPRHLFQPDVKKGRIFRLLETEATLISLADGSTVWRAAVPADAFAAVQGLSIPFYAVRAEAQPLTLLLLDPATGKINGRVPLPAKTDLHEDPGGGFYVLGKDLILHDPDGRERARVRDVDPPNLRAGPDFAALFSGERLAIRDRNDLQLVGALSGSYSVAAGSSLAAELLIYHYIDEGKKPGEALLVRRKQR